MAIFLPMAAIGIPVKLVIQLASFFTGWPLDAS